MLYRFGRRLLGPFFRGMYRMKIQGRQHIPQEGKLILCCNHQSLLDPCLLSIAVPKRQVYYMAKSELFENHGKWFGGLLRRLGGVPRAAGYGRYRLHAAGPGAAGRRENPRDFSAGPVCQERGTFPAKSRGGGDCGKNRGGYPARLHLLPGENSFVPAGDGTVWTGDPVFPRWKKACTPAPG